MSNVTKGSRVRSTVMGDFGGIGFVHYILDDGMAYVEFPIWGKAWIPVGSLEKVEA